ncbi:2-hydroxyacid dehydrogenase [Colwelliaceae bacterium 6441]
MTKPLIPFISQLPLVEQLQWVERLNQLMPNVNVTIASAIEAIDKSQCELAIVANPLPEELLSFTHLIWVQSLWAGVERLVSEIENPSFEIVRLVDPCLAQTMADAVVAWSYYLHRDMPLYASQQKNKHWLQHRVSLTTECTIGVLGLGELGLASAKKLALNGFNVLGWSQQEKAGENMQCYVGPSGLHQVISQSDIVVILLPLTDKTTDLLDKTLFSLMKSGAGLINFSRGKIINDNDLMSALTNGIISHAVLDVFAQEPLPVENSLWSHPNVTVLPHISAPTNIDTACNIVKNNIDEFFLTRQFPPSIDLAKGY